MGKKLSEISTRLFFIKYSDMLFSSYVVIELKVYASFSLVSVKI